MLVNLIWSLVQTTLPDFGKGEFSVVRQHEEFIWLHDRFEDNEEYAGFIVSLNSCCSLHWSINVQVHYELALAIGIVGNGK